ncbi:class I SAM-dependent methyltransferase [Kineosporia succinea]|uniref:Isonocardicin synthase n=1 Tax=Kineosporia succinea TaxID=84632 RepID=A0ABT9P4Y7_9ACTN|nr:class I SAM-dependent methyltransferase [Kineosporia succinea]MDP9827766.1 isonocardicin synthase [Kineosporia succinea]
MSSAEAEWLPVEKDLLAAADIPAAGPVSAFRGSVVRDRGRRAWTEPLDRFPQNLFTVRVGGDVVVGRKLLSPLWQQGLIAEPYCSRVRAGHVLGVLDTFRSDSRAVSVFFHPFTEAERRGVIDVIARRPGTEIVFPFSKVYPEGEMLSPPQGWSLPAGRPDSLARGEELLREVSVGLVAGGSRPDPVVFDPACSTGDFLAAVKRGVPGARTIGQDLSAEMAGHAASRVDEVHHADAAFPVLADGTADFVFCRFLNAEVVTTLQARRHLARLSRVVAPGGVLVVFGHTPVLVTGAEIAASGLSLETCSASGGEGSVFQFYSARRA